MSRTSYGQLSNGALLRSLNEEIALGRRSTAKVLALISEVDVRRLYASEGFSCLFEFCVRRLGFSEDEASRRIHAAKAARRFPIIYDLIADGRLHLSGVKLLRPHLTPDTANSLLRASIHKSRDEIRQLLADRFPRPDVPTRIVALPSGPTEEPNSANGTQPVSESGDRCDSPVPGPVKAPENCEFSSLALPTGTKDLVDSQPVAPTAAPVAPLGTERYALQVTVRKETHDLLREAQELLGHRVSAGDVAEVLHRALESFVGELKKKKFAATSRPAKPRPRKSENPRHIPARVRREVWNRDEGRCTFVGDGGHRCDARSDLEFDHAEPVARGGDSAASNLRLRCRTHNQLEADRVFGHAFMEGMRLQC